MTFNTPAIERLAAFLEIPAGSDDIKQLTPDASTREFFRVPWRGTTAIACVYPEPIDEKLPQIDVTRLFLECGIPVARIFEIAPSSGLLIHEDFGDRILRDALREDPTKVDHIDEAIKLIAQIQSCTKTAFDSGSIASHLKFDREKLLWELGFFKTHYFESLRETKLDSSIDDAVTEEFKSLANELELHASVLTHRDFHAANLMLQDGHLRIIDHQDARIGSPCYDLVSLLLDRIEKPPADAFLEEKKHVLQRERASLGMGLIEDIDRKFDLVTVQRCLKAIGTFSNQAANFEKHSYLTYINPMFGAVSKACVRLERFENIREMVENELLISE